MKLIDMHCDTLMKLLEQPEKSLAELDAEVNLPGLKQAGSMAQFFCLLYQPHGLSPAARAGLR